MLTKANDHFGSSNGSGTFYAHQYAFLYTEGVKELVEACQSYWLLDLIISHQYKPALKQQPFQSWELIRAKETTFDVIATDGNHHIIASQQIEYSDFRYDQAIIWLVDNILMLPKEY